MFEGGIIFLALFLWWYRTGQRLKRSAEDQLRNRLEAIEDRIKKLEDQQT